MTEIDLGGILLDCTNLSQLLKQDLKDDWFPDPLLYNDLLAPSRLSEAIKLNLQNNHGKYSPGEVQIFDIPKKAFVVRYAIEKNIHDRVFYHGLTVYLLRKFDHLLSDRSMSHRLNTRKSKSNKFLFKNGVQQWNEYRGIIQSQCNGKVLLETDITNFFECISIEYIRENFDYLIQELDESVYEKAYLQHCINILFEKLPCWTFDLIKKGLPQNRDASSFLANVLLDRIDRAMLNKGYDYWRYMDDIRIVCPNIHVARKGLLDLTRELRKIELNVNSGKTNIITDPDEIKASLSTDPRIERINYLWQSKKLPSIYRSIQDLVALTEELITKNKTQDREFRFCMNRLVKLALCDEIYLPQSITESISNAIILELENNPVSSDKFISFLTCVTLTEQQLNNIISYLEDPIRSIYSWQNYLIWRMLSIKKHRSGRLMRLAFKHVENPNTEKPELAGSLLYIGCLGSTMTKAILSKNFSRISDYFGQRSALIALHELPWKIIEKNVAPHVLPNLFGVYKNLHLKDNRGTYIVEPKRIKASELFESLESDHDS